MGWCGWRRKISRDTCSSSVLSEVAKSPRRVDMASLSALVVDDSAVPASAASIIVDMLGDVFGMTSPKPFQVTTIYLLAFLFSTVLLIQKTGAGKSLVILGAAALLGGVIVVIEPLVAVGADQARSVSEKTLWIKSFHVAGIDEKSKRRLAKYLTAMLSRERRPVILFLSADDVKPGSRWAMPLKQLFERGLVSLVAFDEIQKILADGRYFREELGMLEENVIRLIGLSPCRVSQLHMTATIEKLALSSYKSMMGGLHFEYTIHGDVSRRDIHLFVGINTQPTQAAKAVVKKHLREPHRKVIVYTNSLECASGPLLKAFRALIASSPDLSGDVMSITGKSGVILKTYVAERFSSSEASHSLDLRVVTGTSSFGCGVSSPYCGACVHHGIPENIEALAQILGRAGRAERRAGAIANEFHVILNVPSLAYLLCRIERTPSTAEKKLQLASAMDVLKLLVLPDKCIHLTLEERFGSQKRGHADETTDDSCVNAESEDRKSSCWYCLQSGPAVLPVYRHATIELLNAEAFNRGQLPASEVAAILYRHREVVWGGLVEATRRDSHLLVLQLVAAKILNCEVRVKAATAKKETSFVLCLEWLRVAYVSAAGPSTRGASGHPVARKMAYSDISRWAGIQKHADMVYVD